MSDNSESDMRVQAWGSAGHRSYVYRQQRMTKMFFKLEYTVEQLWIPLQLVLTFDYGGPHQVRVVLRSPSQEEMVQGTLPSRGFCIASSVFQPNEKVREVFAKIAANQILPEDVNASYTLTTYETPE